MSFYYNAQCSSYFAQCSNIFERFRRGLSTFLVPENPRALFCVFSNSPTRCVDAKSFAQRFSYANLNIDREIFISWFVVFCLKILLCVAASSAGEFGVRFNVNFKLFLYFNSDLLPSTRSFFSVLSPLVRLICAAKMQDSNRYWSFVSLQSVRRLIVIVNFMFVIIIVLWVCDHSLFSLWFAGISFLVLACVFPLIMAFVSGKLRNHARFYESLRGKNAHKNSIYLWSGFNEHIIITYLKVVSLFLLKSTLQTDWKLLEMKLWLLRIDFNLIWNEMKFCSARCLWAKSSQGGTK